MDAAARIYFGVSARQLTLWQAAVLAGLPRAPSRFNPRVDPGAAAARAREVLAAMAPPARSRQPQAEQAAGADRVPADPPVAAGWFADWAAEPGEALLPPDADAALRTTLDAASAGGGGGAAGGAAGRPGAAAGACAGRGGVLDAATGAVRAMVGGRDYRQSAYNRAMLARRQPGSAFKPFVWLAALEKGMRPDDTVLDAPIRVGNWSPRISSGATWARSPGGGAGAVDQHRRGAAAAARRRPAAVAAAAHRLGIADQLPNDASLALGTGEVGLLELTAAYAAFFNGGPRSRRSAIGRRRRRPTETRRAPPPDAVIDPKLAAMMVRMLAAVVSRGTGARRRVPGHMVAGKTGTTQDYRDAWFIGWIDGEIIGVWLGNDNNAPMNDVQGGSLPARLFQEIAAAVVR